MGATAEANATPGAGAGLPDSFESSEVEMESDGSRRTNGPSCSLRRLATGLSLETAFWTARERALLAASCRKVEDNEG